MVSQTAAQRWQIRHARHPGPAFGRPECRLLCRASTPCFHDAQIKDVDGRNKSSHDAVTQSSSPSAPGSAVRMLRRSPNHRADWRGASEPVMPGSRRPAYRAARAATSSPDTA